jgi:hypothetical protein
VEAGLVDGRKIFVDSSLVDAEASNNSVIDTRSLKVQLQESYKKLEARLEEKSESTDTSRRYVKENSRYISSSDPDAGGESFGSGEARHQDEAASDGAFVCQGDVVWF